MAQILVRGIDDEAMRAFREQARARGVSTEQAVRELIETAAREGARLADWYTRAGALRERIRARYGELPSSVEMLREDRDSR